MKLKSCLLVLTLLLTACSDDPSNTPAPRPYYDRVYSSAAAKGLAANGMELRCDFSCDKVTDEALEALKNQLPSLYLFKKKLSSVRFADYKEISFSSPVGSYEIELPYNLTEAELIKAVDVLKKVLRLEETSKLKVYVAGVTSEFSEALDVLLANPATLSKFKLSAIYLTDSATGATDYGYTNLNVITINSSLDRLESHVAITLKARNTMPHVVFLPKSEDEQNYNFIKAAVEFAAEVNEAVGQHELTILHDLRGESDFPDFYITGINLLGSGMIGIHSELSTSEFIKLISYEAFLAKLTRELHVRVMAMNNMSSYSKFPICADKLPKLEEALLAKKDKLSSVEIDYGFLEEAGPSNYTAESENLRLNCFSDSVETLLDLIDAI